MYNWSVDEKAMRHADPEGYQIWRLGQLINYGLGGEKLDRALLKKYWNRFSFDRATRAYLAFLLWPKHKRTS